LIFKFLTIPRPYFIAGLVRGVFTRVIIDDMIKPKVTVTNVQQARDAIQKALRELMTDKFVMVGIHEDAGQHDDSTLSMAQVGAVNEFGTQHIPARPWLNPGVASGNAEYYDIITKTMADGGTPEQALNKVGVVAVGKVQKYMTDLRTPPNAASTIKKKGSSNPLIDSGAMRQSVTYKIDSGKPTEGL